MPRIVKSLTINEVSVVRRAANQHAQVLLAKSDDAPQEGSARERFELAVQQIKRGSPGMPMKDVRAHAWNSLSDDEQIELLREEREENMKKLLDRAELFADWYSRLDAS